MQLQCLLLGTVAAAGHISASAKVTASCACAGFAVKRNLFTATGLIHVHMTSSNALGSKAQRSVSACVCGLLRQQAMSPSKA